MDCVCDWMSREIVALQEDVVAYERQLIEYVWSDLKAIMVAKYHKKDAEGKWCATV